MSLQLAGKLNIPKSAKDSSGDRSQFAKIANGVLLIVLIATALFSLAWGASDTSPIDILLHWSGLSDAAVSKRDWLIIGQIRFPRMVMGILIGAALAVSGAVMQGLFRNPLADPGIVGVSAGASLGAVSMIVLGGTTYLGWFSAMFGIYALPIAAFLGGLVTTLLLYRVSTRKGQTSVATMLLAGIALAALANALTGILIYRADDLQLRDLTFWGLGSLAGATWTKILSAGVIIIPALAAAPFLARGLNGLALGEASAYHIGIPIQKLKNTAIVAVAAATGAAVAVSGGIGFVGIVVPHLLRLLIGPDHRYLLPACATLGATMLLMADAVSRTIVAPAELPIGIITAIIGAPFFLWILLRRRGLLDI